MKISQIRKLVDAAADQHDGLGRKDLGEGLRKLSAALKSADKQTVESVVRRLSR